MAGTLSAGCGKTSEQKNRDMKKKLKEYKDEGPIKWEEFKTNFKHDMDGMEKTMTDLFKDNA